MKIEVRFFASLVDKAGCSCETVDILPGDDVQALWQRLVERHPRLDGLGFRPLAACDRDYAGWDTPLAGVEEVAFLPPVSGG